MIRAGTGLVSTNDMKEERHYCVHSSLPPTPIKYLLRSSSTRWWLSPAPAVIRYKSCVYRQPYVAEYHVPAVDGKC